MGKGQPDTANVTPKGLLTNDNNNSAIWWPRTRERGERAHDTHARVTLPAGDKLTAILRYALACSMTKFK